jgi:formamidopyrimidine-DNA glycosylase
VPELSDVEGFRRHFHRYASRRRINGVAVADPMLVRNASAAALARELAGRRFGEPERHGKWLIAPADDARVLIHFGMTGLLVWSSGMHDRHRHDRIVFELSGGELRYRNMRRLGGIWLARSETEREDLLGSLGPDVLELDADDFAERIARRRGGIKSALMDQRVVAGLGNLLTDELLWRTRVHPRRPAARIPRRGLNRMHGEMVGILQEANRHGRVPGKAGWLTWARHQRDPRCPRCEGPLRRATVAGRTAVWCPRCQRTG